MSDSITQPNGGKNTEPSMRLRDFIHFMPTLPTTMWKAALIILPFSLYPATRMIAAIQHMSGKWQHISSRKIFTLDRSSLTTVPNEATVQCCLCLSGSEHSHVGSH